MWLALRPGFAARARMPPTAQSPAPRGGRRGLPVLTAGSVWGRPRRAHPGVRRSRPCLVERSEVLARFPPRGPDRGTGRPESIKRPENNWASRRRGELDRDSGSRRISQTVDALRRLNERRAASTRTATDPLAPSDPRQARSDQDEDREARKARRWPRHRDPNT